VSGEDAAPDTWHVPPGLADAYELLRYAAIESSSRGSSSLQGLGILIHKGMAAWMNACAAAVPPTVAPPVMVGDVAQVLPSMQRDVIDVLAAMALTSAPEVRT
jgi:hypothetical protein